MVVFVLYCLSALVHFGLSLGGTIISFMFYGILLRLSSRQLSMLQKLLPSQ